MEGGVVVGTGFSSSREVVRGLVWFGLVYSYFLSPPP